MRHFIDIFDGKLGYLKNELDSTGRVLFKYAVPL